MTTALPDTRPALVRPTEGRYVAGVCAGVATHLGIPVRVLRIFVALSCAALFGLPVYGFLWLTVPVSEGRPVVAITAGAGERVSPSKLALVIAVVAILGIASTTSTIGAGFAIVRALPFVAIAGGAMLVWSQVDARGRDDSLSRREGLLRLSFGIACTFVGIAFMVAGGGSLTGLRESLVATAAVLFGVAVLSAPFVMRAVDTYRSEQAERIRVTEKADIAAHLHDSVLQTLALIQRRAGDAGAVTMLARSQERELRQWLYAEEHDPQESLAAAVAHVVHSAEELHETPIDLVVSGDCPVDDRIAALIKTIQEAAANAVRHGRPPISVYVEVGLESVEAFVRDHGDGFDLADIPAGRLGVRESIVGRMHRHGGTAHIRRRDDGTEIMLSMPLNQKGH